MRADGDISISARPLGRAALPDPRFFQFYSTVDNKTHDLGLGKYPEVSIDKARKKAFEYRVKIADGVDLAGEHLQREVSIPLTELKPTPGDYTFERAAYEYIASQEAGWSAGSTEQWTNTLATYAFPVIGAMTIDKVDTDDVLRVLEPIWKTKHETASRIRTRIERILDWAKAKGLRNGGDNPARWKGHLEHLLAGNVRRVEHFEAVKVKDAPAFMRKVRACPLVPARALELLALTATRADEVRSATFAEFD